jgi:hypothetical protein
MEGNVEAMRGWRDEAIIQRGVCHETARLTVTETMLRAQIQGGRGTRRS